MSGGAAIDGDLSAARVIERELWLDGPPHELFARMRSECSVHWSSGVSEFPSEAGFWSVTRAEDVQTVSRDWRTYSSERGGITAVTEPFPLELMRAMFIGMDPPKHDRLKMLFQAGFTPKRIAAHEPAIRRIVTDVLERLQDGETCDLVPDVAQPVVSRVIGSFMGIPPEDDQAWATLMNSALGAGDPDLNPGGVESVAQNDIPEIFERCRRMIAERRENPTDDLTSVLVHAEIDGQRLEEHELHRERYEVGAFNVRHRMQAFGYAIVENARPGRFDDKLAIELGVPFGPDFGRLQRGETVNGVRPEQVIDLRHRAGRTEDSRGGKGRDVVRGLESRRVAL